MFVMQYYHMSWEDALHMVQNRRYCISPNGGFLTQIKVCILFHGISMLHPILQEYESIYKANAAVAAHPARQGAASRRKRDDEDEMDGYNF